MDTLSGVLESVRLEGAIYLNAEFTAPWCIRGCYGMVSLKDRLAGAEHVVYFHHMIEGACKVRLVDSDEVLEVRVGDLVLFPQDDRHLMGSDLHLAPVDTDTLEPVESPPGSADLVHFRVGGGGALTRFVCGYLACNRHMLRPLIDALPRIVRVPIGDGHASSALRELLRMGVKESSAPAPGGGPMLARLAELMFVEALRRYVETLPPDGKGWLAGMRDAHVGRALSLLHDLPGKPWTVDELAREVALSRSALAGRFVALVGESPIQYLKRWRLALAARALRVGSDAIARVAERSGYESEATFSRAFKREFGVPPAAWRKRK